MLHSNTVKNQVKYFHLELSWEKTLKLLLQGEGEGEPAHVGGLSALPEVHDTLEVLLWLFVLLILCSSSTTPLLLLLFIILILHRHPVSEEAQSRFFRKTDWSQVVCLETLLPAEEHVAVLSEKVTELFLWQTSKLLSLQHKSLHAVQVLVPLLHQLFSLDEKINVRQGGGFCFRR